jgi:phosphoglycerate dehydrogenase-like enzyme
VGYDSVDVAAANKVGITVAITPGANTQAVADYAVTLMLAGLRKLPLFHGAVQQGGWRPTGGVLGRDLFGSTVGVFGLGAIGRAVVSRIAGFGVRILAVEPYPDEEFCRTWNVSLVDDVELLSQSDVITLHAPLTESTFRFLNAERLAIAKPGIFIVNTARGGLIDEAALASALDVGKVSGAALDVLEIEPAPADHSFRFRDNVLVTGHVASFTRNCVRKLCEDSAAAFVAVSCGKKPAGMLSASR